MKTNLWRWLALLALPGCLVVQPLDDAKSNEDLGGGGKAAHAGGPAASGGNNTPKGGSGGAPNGGGGKGGSPGTGGSPNANCDQITLPSGDYGEKTVVGICFSILWDGLTCSYDESLDETACTGNEHSFYIAFSETADGTQADIYDYATDTHIGYAYQDSDNNYQYDLITGASLTCYVTADTAQLCVNSDGTAR